MFDMIRSDINRKQNWFLKEKPWLIRNLRVFLEPGTMASIVYRMGSWACELKIPLVKHFFILIYLFFKIIIVVCFGIYIPAKAKIGKGFTIHNFSGIFVCEATIGENCIIFQNVTIGHLRGKPNPPTIGNNVLLGAGAKILGDVTIGNNVVVGANSLVINDIPDNCTVLGVPARIISRETDWINEKLEGRSQEY